MDVEEAFRRIGRFLRAPILVAALQTTAGCGAPPRLEAEDSSVAEKRWELQGPSSYSIEVWISNHFERRVEVTVEKGVIREAILRERDEGEEDWGPRIELDERRARPYTVPGLFQTLREELAAEQRSVRASFQEELGYPLRIELGSISEGQGRVISVRALVPDDRASLPLPK